MKSSDSLRVGEVYSRQDLRELFGIEDATINNGVFRPRGHDSVWIFVTESKTPDRTQYQDALEGDELHWDGQLSGRTDRLIIDHEASGLELLVFYRKAKYEFENAGFRFEGPFRYVSHTDGRPAHFLLRRNAGLKAIPTRKTSPTSYWTFFCNPRRWQIDEFLRSRSDEDDYRITDWQAKWFGPGQLGVVRVGHDTRTKDQLAGKSRLEAGIYAIVQVLGTPKLGVGSADPYWLEAPPENDEHLAVDIRYVKNLLDQPLLLDTLKTDPAVTDRYLLEGFQGASMPLDPSTFSRILALSGTEPHTFDAVAPEPTDSLTELERRYAGASPEVKEAISRRIERGPVAAKVKEATGHRCQICLALGLNPIAFIKRDGQPYVEAHHVSFVSWLAPGTLGPSNIITVCPNHHRQLHYGNAHLVDSMDGEFIFRLDGVAVRVPRMTVPLGL